MGFNQESVVAVFSPSCEGISKIPEDGRLIVQNPGCYALFQTQLLRSESWVPELDNTQLYTFGLIEAHGWRLDRTETGAGDKSPGKLIPEHEGPIRIQLRLGLLVLEAGEVENAVDKLGDRSLVDDWPPAVLPAERLFRSLRSNSLKVGGVAIEACGTYQANESGVQLVVVDSNGGYSVGISGMEGIAQDEDLTAPMCIRAIKSAA